VRKRRSGGRSHGLVPARFTRAIHPGDMEWNHRKGPGFPASPDARKGIREQAFSLLQWDSPKPRKTFRSMIGADYAIGRLADIFERLPRCAPLVVVCWCACDS
jgi:hypothetical protein